MPEKRIAPTNVPAIARSFANCYDRKEWAGAFGPDPTPKIAQWLASARDIASRANSILGWIGELRRLSKDGGNESASLSRSMVHETHR